MGPTMLPPGTSGKVALMGARAACHQPLFRPDDNQSRELSELPNDLGMLPFPRRLFLLRSRQGLSQDELAEAAGLHHSTISFLENGNHLPRFDTIRKLAHVLKVKLSELLGDN